MSSKFNIGDKVCKIRGSWWAGRVVGFYSTEQTPDGVCVQMITPDDNGPVQIYPAEALKIASVVEGLQGAFAEITKARKAHIEAVNTYNERLTVVNSERARGNHSMKVDREFRAMSEAQSEFIRTAQRLADEALGKETE
jgi:hypothetical protein